MITEIAKSNQRLPKLVYFLMFFKNPIIGYKYNRTSIGNELLLKESLDSPLPTFHISRRIVMV